MAKRTTGKAQTGAKKLKINKETIQDLDAGLVKGRKVKGGGGPISYACQSMAIAKNITC